MSEQVLRSGNVMERSRTRTITQIAMLGALAGVLMNIEFPIPFLAPSFYQLDFSEIPVLSRLKNFVKVPGRTGFCVDTENAAV